MAEPVIVNGKNLEAWVNELGGKQEALVRGRAEQAIKEIGTNALPFLVEETRILGQAWTIDITNFYSTPVMVTRLMNVRTAFKILGSVASPAIPQLEKLLNQGVLADSAAYDLTQIDGEAAAKNTFRRRRAR